MGDLHLILASHWADGETEAGGRGLWSGPGPPPAPRQLRRLGALRTTSELGALPARRGDASPVAGAGGGG